MKNYLNPCNDFVFKLFFSTPENKPLLISFLESVIRPSHPIKEVGLLNSELCKDALDEKTSFLDLYVELDNGTRIDIEMQMVTNRFFKKRLLYYWSRLHAKQLGTGIDYSKLLPTISITILADIEFKNCPDDAHSLFELRERKRNELYLPDLEIHFLELPKLARWTDDKDINYDKLERWMRFFNLKNEPEGCTQKLAKDPVMSKALKALEILSQNPDARALAEMREDARINYISGINAAHEEGEEKGRAEGKLEGKAEGEINSIKKLSKKGISPEDISNLLDIDLDKILEILKS